MKHGDQVSTPNGIGIFFDRLDKDDTKAYVRLKDPTENKVWIPLIEVFPDGRPAPQWECFPCDVFNILDLKLDKTLEQRQREAREQALRQKAARDAELQRRMQEFNEQQRRMHEQATNQTGNPA